MTVYTERNNKTILSAVIDADGDPLSVVRVNGQAGLVGVPIALSVGGSVTVASDGVVTFDDTGFTVPEIGDNVADGLIATISDGTVEIDTSVNLELFGAAPAQAALFGGLTRAFEGGIAAPAGATTITGGDPDGHFVVSNGMILPSAAGAGNLTGSYTLTFDAGDAQEIVALFDTFSVLGDTELSTLLNDSTQPYDGKAILLRPGQYGAHLIPPQTLTGLTLRGETGAILTSLRIRPLSGAPTVVLRDLTVRPSEIEGSFVSRVFIDANPTPNGTLRIENCRIEGHLDLDANSDVWWAKVDYTGATGVFEAGETLMGSNNGVISLEILQIFDNGDGSGTLWLNDDPGKGDGGTVRGNRLADGVTVTGDTSGVTAQAAGAIYGGDPSISYGLICVGPAFENFYVENNCFARLEEALRVAGTKIIEVTENICDECRSDFIKTVSLGDTRPSDHFHIKRNLHIRPFGRGEDFGNPHVDGIQFILGAMNFDLTGLEITDNVFMLGGRADKVQPVFLTLGSGAGAIEGGIVANNIFDTGEAMQVRAPRWRGGEISGNSGAFLLDVPHSEIRFTLGETLADANTVFARNITEGISYYTADARASGLLEDPVGNYLPGKNPDWSAVYDNLTGTHALSLSDLFLQLTPKDSSSLMAGTNWVEGSDMGCVSEAGRMIAADGTDITDVLFGLEAKLSQVVQFQLPPGQIQDSHWNIERIDVTTLELELLEVPSGITQLAIYVDAALYETKEVTTPGVYPITISNPDTVEITLVPFNSSGAGPQSETRTVLAFGAAILSVADFAVDAWPYDVRAVYGESTAKIPVSGSIDPVQEGVSIRARQAGTTGAGQIIGTTAADGTFTGHMDALEDGQNHQLEVFVDGNAAINTTTTNTYSTGNPVLPIAQSQFRRAIEVAGSLPAPALADPDNLIYVKMDRSAATATTASDPTLIRMTDAAATTALKYMSNAYAAIAPGKKFVLFDGTQDGTGLTQLMDDANTARHFSVEYHMIQNWLRGTVGDNLSFMMHLWLGQDRPNYQFGGDTARFRDSVAPYFFLEGGDGTPLNLGDAHPLGGYWGNVDHAFFDDQATSGQRGQGLFAEDEAKVMFVNHVLNFPLTTPLSRFGDNSLINYRRVPQNIDWFLANDARAIARGFTRGYDNTVFRLDDPTNEGSDYLHPTINDRHGAPLALEMIALNHCKALGVVTTPVPQITDAVWSETDVSLSVVVGTGNRLTTYRDELSLGPIEAEAHRAPLAGFEFERAGAYDRPTSIAITDDGSTTGTATIVITRDNQNEDVLTFAEGIGNGHLNQNDYTDGYHLNFPVVALNGLSNPLIPLTAFPEGGFLTAAGLEVGSFGGTGPNLFADETFTNVAGNWNVTGGGWTQVSPNGIAKVAGTSFQSFRQFAFQLTAGTEYTFSVNVSDISVLHGNVRFDVSNSSTFNIEVPLAPGGLSVTFTPTASGPHNFGFISRSGTAVFEIDKVYIGTTN